MPVPARYDHFSLGFQAQPTRGAKFDLSSEIRKSANAYPVAMFWNWKLPRANWLPTWLYMSYRRLPPTFSECRPRIHDRLSLNSNAWLRFVYGPSVSSPKPLNPVMLIDGMPHASEENVARPGMASSVTTSRTFASSRPYVLKK